MRLILDTNIIVSAAVSPGSPCAELLRALRARKVDVVVSPALIAELATVLDRPKFRRYLKTEVGVFIDGFQVLCHKAADPGGLTGVTRDSKDDYLVALAIAENVDAVVSGDKDLLVLDPSIVRVLTAREALREVYR